MGMEYFGHQGPAVGGSKGVTTDLLDDIRQCLVSCDSELSAQAHGRPASDKEELSILSNRCRRLAEKLRSK